MKCVREFAYYKSTGELECNVKNMCMWKTTECDPITSYDSGQ